MAIEFNGVRWTQPEVDFMTDLFTPDDRVKVKALIKSIMGPGRFTEDTNKKCARLLNLCSNQDSSKYPDLVPCYDSVHEGLLEHSDFNVPGLFLYKKQVKKIPRPLKARKQDLKNRNGEVVECDPDFPLCLVYFVPSGVCVIPEDNMYASKAHFCGNNNLTENESAVFRHANHSEAARSDKRIKVRCCFRYRVRATADAQSSKKQKAALVPPGSNGARDFEDSNMPAAKRQKVTDEQVTVMVTYDGQDHVTAANAASDAALREYLMTLLE